MRQFEYLVAVVDNGSFTRAAEQLHVTQPALSHQIRAVERDLGGSLLERLPRATRLTPLGRAVLPHARAALADSARAVAAARRVTGLSHGEIQLATMVSGSLGVLPVALRAWHETHPGIAIRLMEHMTADALQSTMAAGQADLAVGPEPEGWEGPMRRLGVEELVIVVSHGDPAVGLSEDGRRRVPLRELKEREWVHYEPGHGMADLLDQACADAGYRPRIAVRTNQAAAGPLLAAAGMGPTLVPANMVPGHIDGRILLPDPPIRRTLTAYTRTRPDPLTAAFADTLSRHIHVLPPHVQQEIDGVDAAPDPDDAAWDGDADLI
ncbi:LysR family transcriptional regulator [Mangrovactinospora gilvigrisea]|uniref:LysR family transcriptional regulator n=1 Tax=Mangrovactinospora gilvigrisea TaxID=1428644 RepID=A0A1J7BGI4_9ACTN|nr:LysR family transcriptional regulator [Mangrovactinospora gilvigrisea]